MVWPLPRSILRWYPTHCSAEARVFGSLAGAYASDPRIRATLDHCLKRSDSATRIEATNLADSRSNPGMWGGYQSGPLPYVRSFIHALVPAEVRDGRESNSCSEQQPVSLGGGLFSCASLLPSREIGSNTCTPSATWLKLCNTDGNLTAGTSDAEAAEYWTTTKSSLAHGWLCGLAEFSRSCLGICWSCASQSFPCSDSDFTKHQVSSVGAK